MGARFWGGVVFARAIVLQRVNHVHARRAREAVRSMGRRILEKAATTPHLLRYSSGIHRHAYVTFPGPRLVAKAPQSSRIQPVGDGGPIINGEG